MQSLLYLGAFLAAVALGNAAKCFSPGESGGGSPMAQFNGPWPAAIAKLGKEPVMDLGPSLLYGAANALMVRLRANPQGRNGRQIYQESVDRAAAKILRRLGIPPPHTNDAYLKLDEATKIQINRVLIWEMCDVDKIAQSANEPWFTADKQYDTPTYDRYHEARITWPDPKKQEAWAADL